jgi:hypothetical protein
VGFAKARPIDVQTSSLVVITRARVPHGRYWHSSDVKPEGHRPEGFMELRANIICVWHESTCNN